VPTAYDQALVRRAGDVWHRQSGLPLCDVCGAKDNCQLRSGLATLGKVQRAKVMISTCGTFVPVMGFQDAVGLEGEFNTFRKGLGWARRTQPGLRVGLYDLKGETMIGFARVEAIIEGALGDLLRSHGAFNHLMKAVPAGDAPEALHKALRRAYGTTYAAATVEFCVIEMRREE
jgi:hypothetical protein